MKRVLIVNADDCNLTPGVTRAILDSHDRGILTSTTFMINLPVERETVRKILQRTSLGTGIHLNVTFGRPVSSLARVQSLIERDGSFRKYPAQISRLPKREELFCEYQSQIKRFLEVFGRAPTHLDTHHQVHDHPFFLRVLAEISRKNHLPIRRSRAMRMGKFCTTDYLFGNLSPAGYWTQEPLETILRNLPAGISEIMCHPGLHDKALEAVSSFRNGRQKEWKLLSAPSLRRFAARQGVVLAHFGCVILQTENSRH